MVKDPPPPSFLYWYSSIRPLVRPTMNVVLVLVLVRAVEVGSLEGGHQQALVTFSSVASTGAPVPAG